MGRDEQVQESEREGYAIMIVGLRQECDRLRSVADALADALASALKHHAHQPHCQCEFCAAQAAYRDPLARDIADMRRLTQSVTERIHGEHPAVAVLREIAEYPLAAYSDGEALALRARARAFLGIEDTDEETR